MCSTSSEKYWYEITVDIDSTGKDVLSDYLFESGSCGLEEKESSIVAFFDSDADLNSVLINVNHYLEVLQTRGIRSGKPVSRQIPAQNWNEEWQAYFKPVQVTDNMIVKPPWEIVETDGLVIDIMPKMAFGTGTHETTQLCLQFLESLDLKGKCVLDAGTGSGILSIAAVKLGADQAEGVDIDQESIENAYENAALNRVTDKVHFQMDGFNCFSPFHIILANINRSVLTHLIPDLFSLSVPETVFIFSGVLAEETDLFEPVLQAQGLQIEKKRILGEWIAYLAVRSS